MDFFLSGPTSPVHLRAARRPNFVYPSSAIFLVLCFFVVVVVVVTFFGKIDRRWIISLEHARAANFLSLRGFSPCFLSRDGALWSDGGRVAGVAMYSKATRG